MHRRSFFASLVVPFLPRPILRWLRSRRHLSPLEAQRLALASHAPKILFSGPRACGKTFLAQQCALYHAQHGKRVFVLLPHWSKRDFWPTHPNLSYSTQLFYRFPSINVVGVTPVPVVILDDAQQLKPEVLCLTRYTYSERILFTATPDPDAPGYHWLYKHFGPPNPRGPRPHFNTRSIHPALLSQDPNYPKRIAAARSAKLPKVTGKWV